MISRRLIGRKISPTEISSDNIELSEAVEKWRMRDLSAKCAKYILNSRDISGKMESRNSEWRGVFNKRHLLRLI